MQIKNRSLLFVKMFLKIQLILLKTQTTIIIGGNLFNWKFAEIVYLVKTSVNLIECFTNFRPSMPTKAVLFINKRKAFTATIHSICIQYLYEVALLLKTDLIVCLFPQYLEKELWMTGLPFTFDLEVRTLFNSLSHFWNLLNCYYNLK